MFSLEFFRDLFRHMEWADAIVWSAVIDCEAARTNEALVEKLRHLHRTQQYFLKVWRREDLSYEKLELPLGDELALVRAWHAETRTWLDTLSGADLAGELSMPWADHFAKRAGAERAAPTLLGETMVQIAMHSTYHRGQVNLLLRSCEVTPPLTDYIAWLWLARPEPKWP